jgi:hypothetical protein
MSNNNNRPEKVILSVVQDDCKKEMWMVVIREGNGALIGIPLRGVTKPVAEQNRQSLGFAFDYGAKYATNVIVRKANGLWCSVEHDHNPED